MSELRWPLRIEPRRQGGWQLIVCEGDAFDYTTPFRALLGEIANALGQGPGNDVQLPPYEVGEDFVEGSLQFGNVPLIIYYEHSLSYLALINHSDGILRDVSDRIQRSVQVASHLGPGHRPTVA